MQTKILPSRQALVDRIELQYAYGNNAICLISEVGLGKSYLAESFISEKFAQHNKAYVKATRGMQDRHVMGLILEQSFSSPLIDYELSTLENFSLLAKGELAQLLIVLDDAHFVSDELLSDLFNLTKQYSGKVKILLTSTRQLPISRVINIHIESLSADECMALMRMYYRELPYQEEPLFKAFLQSCKGNAQMLLSWQPDNSKQTLIVERRSQQFTIYKYLLLLVLSLMTVATAVYYFYPDTAEVIGEENQSVRTVITSEKIGSGSEKASQTLASLPESKNNTDSTDSTESTDRTASTESIDITASTESKESIDITASTDSTESTESTESTDSTDSTESIDSTESFTQQAQQDNAWFLTQKSSDYVLQLMVASSLATLEQDIAKHKIKNSHIFVINNTNSTMYGLTYGQFSTFSDAQKAIANLPVGLQKRGIFAKEIAKIQQQITANN